MGQWSKKKKKESAKEVSLFFTNDLIRKGLRRSSPTYFPEALQPFNCQLCMSIKLVASKSRKLEGQMKSKNMDFLDKKRIQIDGISHKDETCNALGWVKKNCLLLPCPISCITKDLMTPRTECIFCVWLSLSYSTSTLMAKISNGTTTTAEKVALLLCSSSKVALFYTLWQKIQKIQEMKMACFLL